MSHQLAIIVSSLCLVCPSNQLVGAKTIWVEGEHAVRHNMQRHGWYDRVTKSALSGSDWLSHYADGEPPIATYQFQVTTAGNYDFWIRCNPVARSRLSYSLNDKPWREIDMAAPVGQANIADDGKPDMRFIAWLRAGDLPLASGPQTIRFKFHSGNQNHGAIDCFVFASTPFRPRGPLKPGQRSGNANPGFFAWEPDTDAFSSDALIDLSYLNEVVAGQDGRVRAEGDRFVLGDNRPVKFWAVNAGPGIWQLDHDSHVYLAKRLSKSGVNMVRLHGPIYGSRDAEVDWKRLDDLQHFVGALKNEGIYSSLSFYFPLWFRLEDGKRPFSLLFFDSQMQSHFRDWAGALLTNDNPYTGLPLGRDPAVAIVEIVNEDSHFFWTFARKNIPPTRWRRLTQLYGDWLKRKYGTLEAALNAWGGVAEEDDRFKTGHVALYDAWSMTSDGIEVQSDKQSRISDQVQFLTENMRGFYLDTINFFRDRCHYHGLVSCGNWHVTDAAMLDALERYCYTAGDVIDHHGYFDHGHSGEASSYSVRPGQQFTSQSALRLAASNPLPLVETEGRPHMISEIGWPAPNMYRAEFTFLTSAYGSLQGLDGVFSFALGSESWDRQLNKFPINTPVTLGCFPAAALIYRRGDVREGPIVVRDNLRLKDLYALKGTAVHTRGSFDTLRSQSIPAGKRHLGTSSGIDPLTFYTGRVVRGFDDPPSDSFQLSMSGLIDRTKKSIRSETEELMWDYDRGLVTMDTRRSQGAAGFLGQVGSISLTNVRIQMKNNYGTVTIVALDDKPIATSNRILIQAMTIEQPYQFESTGKGNLSGRIKSVGTAPFGVEKIDATVTLALSKATPPTVVACDEHGYPRTRAIETSGDAPEFKIVLDSSSAYHVVHR